MTHMGTGFSKRRSFLMEDDKEEDLRQRISSRFGNIEQLENASKEELAAARGSFAVRGFRGLIHRLLLVKLQIQAATLQLKLQIWLFLEEPFATLTPSVLSYIMLVIIIASTLHAMI